MIVLLILILSLFVGALIKAIIKFRVRAIEESVQNVCFLIGLKLIFGAFYNWEIALKIVERELSLLTFSSPNFFQLGTGLFLLVLGALFWQYLDNRLFILNIKGYLPDYEKSIEEHYKDLKLGKFGFKEKEIAFLDPRKGINSNQAEEIIKLIKFKGESFKREAKETKIAFTGIAHTPFVAFTGTFFKRKAFQKYFEFDKKDREVFYSLDEKNNFPCLKQITPLDEIDPESKEIVVSVSTTSKISYSDLEQFNCGVINLIVDMPGDNIITSKKQLFHYRNKIIEVIEQVKKEFPRVSKIHLTCASQSCLAFEIGKSVEDKRHPKIISYHFDEQGEKKYPWGLVLNGSKKGKFING